MKKYKSVYSPQISADSAFLLRRIAWAADHPMTETLDACILALSVQMDRSVLCGACQDHRCLECPISKEKDSNLLEGVLGLEKKRSPRLLSSS